MLKRIFSLPVLFTFYWTLTAQAVGSDAMLRAGMTLYADPEESIVLLVTDEPRRVEIHDVTETHTSVTVDTQNGFVRNDALVHALTRYIQTETDTLDAAGKIIGSLVRGEQTSVYGTIGDTARLFKDGVYVYMKRDVLADKMPRYTKTGRRYALAAINIYQDTDKKQVVVAGTSSSSPARINPVHRTSASCSMMSSSSMPGARCFKSTRSMTRCGIRTS